MRWTIESQVGSRGGVTMTHDVTPPCPRAVRTCLRLAAGQPVTLAGVRLYTGEDEDILGEWPEVTV